MKQPRARVRRGMPLLLFFLLVTLGLSLWLGFQAVDAARSHRLTAQGVLDDYSEIAVAEYSRRIQGRMDRFFRELFEGVPWRIGRRPPPPPDVMAERLDGALRRVGCDCPELRNSAAFLALDFTTSNVESIPDTLHFGEKTRAARLAREGWERDVSERIALRTVGPNQGLEDPSALFFNVSLDESGEEGMGRAIYVLHASLHAASQLFRSWYEEGGLLPEAVAGNQPNEALLHVEVRTEEGYPILLSAEPDPGLVLAHDTLSARYGGLTVAVGVRPEAAPRLIIGGLPRARLPLLLALMLMTVGVGIAAFLQIRKEQELARVRDDFISGVSHEFRTPLTQIRMFTELLADGKLQTDEERVRSTEVINREARRLTHLVENILHFSRMGRAPGSRGTVEEIVFQDALQDLTEAFQPLVEARGCSLVTSVRPSDLVVTATRSGLHRILANLLDNALKYGPDGQEILIGAKAQDGWTRIWVEDQGPGIPVGERARIWDPYHRLDRDVEGEVRGSGIGLSVVAELARSSGGTAWVEDGRNGGSRFVIRLPMYRGQEEERVASQTRARRG